MLQSLTDHLCCAARLCNFLFGALRKVVSGYVQCTINFPVTQHTHSVFRDLADQPRSDQLLGADLRSLFEPCEVRNVHDGVLLPERLVRESALRQTAVQRHLAAFKTPFAVGSRTGPHTFVSARGGLAVSTAGTAADSL